MSMSMPNFSNNEDTLISDIASLQSMEQDLFNSLETDTTLSSSQQNKIVDRIAQLSNMRSNLYQTLTGINNFYENALETSSGTLKEQIVAIGIVESELNRSKQKLNMLIGDRNDKIRLVEINDYYGEKYSEHSKFMKIVIFTLVPIIILTVLNKNKILPDMIFYILVSIIGFIGAIMGWIVFFSIIRRSNMNYQAYDWYFNPANAPQPSTDPNNSTDPWASTNTACVGAACCSSNQTYDSSTNLCVDNIQSNYNTSNTSSYGSTKESFITESMVESILTKQSNDKYKPDVNLAPAISGTTQKSFLYN